MAEPHATRHIGRGAVVGTVDVDDRGVGLGRGDRAAVWDTARTDASIPAARIATVRTALRRRRPRSTTSD
ncbi:MAG: hypothetical protein ACYDD6_05330 [Acidimicrobiales bacterium]